MRSQKRTDTIPAPFVVAPSGDFDGSDGKWSTFKLSLGSEDQEFRVTVSNISPMIWIPIAPGACPNDLDISQSDCASARGIELVDGSLALGFQATNSSTWTADGTGSLEASSELFDGNITKTYGSLYTNLNAIYGQDTATLQSPSSNAKISASESLIAGYTDFNFFSLGSLGLASGVVDFGGIAVPSFMQVLLNSGQIPSHSWAYTAGASYQSNGVAGSLIFGGYDQQRSKGTNATFSMPATTQQTLLEVQVSSFTMQAQNGSTTSLIDGADNRFTATLDSTTPYIYLPDSIVDQLQQALGLTYDSFWDQYTFDGSQSSPDLDNLVFTLTNPSGGDARTSINLSFDALNLTTSWPVLDANNNSQNFFPIRKSADNTYILGRAFFQEAYVVADYGRRTFTVGQAAFPTTSTAQIVTIFNQSSIDNGDNKENTGGSSSKLSGGAIAGIVIGVLAAVLILGLIYFFWWRKKKRQEDNDRNAQQHQETFASAQEEKLGQQANRDRRDTYSTVLSGDTTVSEMAAAPMEHRPSHKRHVSELSSDSETTRNKVRTPSPIFEMPDSSSYLDARTRVGSPQLDVPTRDTSMRTVVPDASSPVMSAVSPAISAREPMSGVSEGAPSAGVLSPLVSPTLHRQPSGTPRGTSKFTEESSDMQG